MIDSMPDMVIGDGGSEPQEFFRIQGLRELPGGSILVVDAASRELRFYGPLGRRLHRAGGRGEGPGEFENPILVDAPGLDSLLLWDTGLRRFQVYSLDGEASRTIRPVERWPAGGRAPVGAIGPDMLVQRRNLGPMAELRAEGPKRQSIDFLWVAPSTGEVQNISTEQIVRTYQVYRSGRPYGTTVIPFSSYPSATVSGRGALVATGATSEIREYDPAGHNSRIFRVNEPRRPVTEEMIDAKIIIEADIAGSRDNWSQTFSEMPIPDSLPSFKSLKLDEVGWLWAEVYSWDPDKPTEWMVFDPAGRAHGTIETSAGLTVHWIGENSILGVAKDTLGVETVHRYKLHRTPGVAN